MNEIPFHIMNVNNFLFFSQQQAEEKLFDKKTKQRRKWETVTKNNNPQGKSTTKEGLSRERRDLLFTNNRNLWINFQQQKDSLSKSLQKVEACLHTSPKCICHSSSGEDFRYDIKELRDVNK